MLISPKNKSKRKITTSTLYRSEQKKDIRQMLADVTPVNGRVLTLGVYLLIDASLFDDIGCQVISLEREEDICKAARSRLPNSYKNINVLHFSFADFVRDVMRGHDCFHTMFLDFHCIWRGEIEDEFLAFFKQRHMRDAHIGITLAYGREDDRIKDTYCYQKVCNYDFDMYKKNRLRVICHTIAALCKKAGKEIKILHSEKYQNEGKDGKKGAPMIFILCKFVKV